MSNQSQAFEYMNSIIPLTPQSTRIDSLDLIRGFALCGILFANLVSFTGFYSLSLEQIVQLPWFDRTTLFVIDWLIESKFYALFSILLGAGFYLHISRATEKLSEPFLVNIWRRRMVILFCIGIIHMFFIWHGDILTLYSVLGISLPFFLNNSNRRLLIWIAVLITAPVLMHVLLLITQESSFWQSSNTFLKSLKISLGYEFSSQLEMRTSDKSEDVFFANLFASLLRPLSYLKTGRYFIVLAYFLIGIYLARKFIPMLKGDQPLLLPTKKSILMLLIPALLFSAAYAWIKGIEGSPFLTSPLGVFQTFCQHLGAILLALAYIAILVKITHQSTTNFFSKQLIKLGRMSFTNYLTQTSLCVLIFYGYGWALMGKVPFYQITFFAAGIIIFQVVFCHTWLRYFPQGPLEILWKKLAYSKNRLAE